MNFKKTLLIISLIPNFLFAQNVFKNKFTIEGGIALPTGTFKATDGKNIKSGFATQGNILDISYLRLLSKTENKNKIYLKFSAGAQTFEYNDAEYKKYLDEVLFNTYQWGITSYRYGTANASLGVRYSRELLKNLSVYADGAMGVLWLQHPDVDARSYKTNDYRILSKQEHRGVGFAYSFSAGVGYNITKRLAINITYSNSNGQVRFKDFKTTSNFGYTSLENYTNSISSNNFCFGIGINF